MSHHQQNQDVQAAADSENDGKQACANPLQPLLQKTANPVSDATAVHSAFIVDAHDNAFFSVSNREQGRRYQVKRAASCLLLPQPGDKVLVSGDPASGLYIIAVLEQCDSERATLQVDGALTVSADELSLKGNHVLAIETDAFSVTAVTSRYTGDKKESYYRFVSETAGQSARYVAGTDTVKAINLDYAADFIARLSGNTTFINGETAVKADGKQIMVG